MKIKNRVYGTSRVWGMVLFILFSLSITGSVYACDACGPSSACNYIGVLPNVGKNFVGIRLNDRAFTIEPYLEHNNLTQETKDRYFSADIWARYFIHPRLQLMGILPYAYHTRNEGGTLTAINGLGDAIAIANYTIYSTPDTVEKDWSHFIQLAGGAKLPTGNYRQSESRHVYHANFQIGSGSTDFLANAIYTIRYKRLGMRTDFGYKYNTANTEGYRFGNKITNNSSLFYWGSFGLNNAIVPQIGLYQEYAYKDISKGYYESNTGGVSGMLNASAELYYSRYSFGINYMHPVQQPDYDYPTKMQHSLRVNFNYFF